MDEIISNDNLKGGYLYLFDHQFHASPNIILNLSLEHKS